MKGYVEHILKELAEYFRRRFLRIKVGTPPTEIEAILDDLQYRGIHVIENYWSAAECAQAIREINQAIEGDRECRHWTDAEQADYRIWEAEKLAGSLAKFLNDPFIETVRKHCSGVAQDEKLLLAARLSFQPNNLGSGGGWHRDSPHSLQFKAILYLSDVAIENGPFEYIGRSHSEWSNIELLRHQLCTANQFRFTNAAIAQIESAKIDLPNAKPYIANRGTLILVNTKGLHRGRPIQAGDRYALTQYCFNGHGKASFLKKLELAGARKR